MNPQWQLSNLAENVRNDIKALVVDIEGTTTPISFVTEVLFPHVRTNVGSYLEKHWETDHVREDIAALRDQAEEDKASSYKDVPDILPETKNKSSIISSVINNVLWLMSHDRKVTALKTLQGRMWESSYRSGEIKGEIYPDVHGVLKTLKSKGKMIYVYSSGSVKAQKLLFKHSERGDLTPLFDGYFDTMVGSKKESLSYAKIAKEIDMKPEKILFLTDVVEEADAASEANFKVCILARPGNKLLSEKDKEKYLILDTFDNLVLEEIPEKRKRIEKER